MKREFATVIFEENRARGFLIGDEHAHRAAIALAERCDAPTIQALTDLMAFLERVGGQAYIVTLRRKDAEEGEFQTEALQVAYESRDAKLIVSPAPTDIGGVPIADLTEPPTRHEMEPEVPEGESALRDEIEEEAAALPEEEPAALPSG